MTLIFIPLLPLLENAECFAKSNCTVCILQMQHKNLMFLFRMITDTFLRILRLNLATNTAINISVKAGFQPLFFVNE